MTDEGLISSGCVATRTWEGQRPALALEMQRSNEDEIGQVWRLKIDASKAPRKRDAVL